MINEHNDPNLAETPHYKEKQTILPHPISAEVDKKLQTPVKRTHDGKPKKDKKDPCKSPMINEQTAPKEVCIKADEAKIDMRKLVIEHKSHKKSSSSGDSSNSMKKHSSSLNISKKDRDKHKSSSGDSHRSHSSSKKPHSSEKHRRDENRKSSSSSSNHSSSSSSLSSTEKHKSSESTSKKEEQPSIQTNLSQSTIVTNVSTVQNEEIDSQKANEVVLPIQVSSSHPIDPAPPANPIIQSSQQQVIPCAIEQQLIPAPLPPPPPPPPPSFDILPPLPKDEMPIEIPPPPPPEEEQKSMASKSGTSPDSSTQQASHSPVTTPKVRKLNNGDKGAPSSDLLGSIMASMDSPRNASNF